MTQQVEPNENSRNVETSNDTTPRMRQRPHIVTRRMLNPNDDDSVHNHSLTDLFWQAYPEGGGLERWFDSLENESRQAGKKRKKNHPTRPYS